MLDPSGEDLREALHAHSRAADDAAASLVFFSGHGATYDKHYLLPADFNAPPGAHVHTYVHRIDRQR